MAETDKPKRPAAARRETMQQGEAQLRTPHYFPDHNRSVMARDAEEARKLLAKELENEEVTEDQTNG